MLLFLMSLYVESLPAMDTTCFQCATAAFLLPRALATLPIT